MFQKQIQKVWEFYEAHERLIGVSALLIGFTIDNLTLTRIDLWLDNLILFSYLFVACFCVVVLNLHDAGRIRVRHAHRLDFWLPLILQYALGGLFSGYVVFYSRSGTLVSSWPFLLTLAGLLVGNEMFRTRYQRIVFRTSIFYIALFSFCIFFVPIVVNAIGAWIFLLSGAVSLSVFGGIIYFLSRRAPAFMRGARSAIFTSIGTIFVVFNILYFLNMIPPLPLALKEIGIYHTAKVLPEGGYSLQYEHRPWYQRLPFMRETYAHVSGTSIYAYTAVFAPTDISTPIRHRWSYYDPRTESWRTMSTVTFTIHGGRDGGYRGYTEKRSVVPGLWRVDVVTLRDQLLGRKVFEVHDVAAEPPLREKIR